VLNSSPSSVLGDLNFMSLIIDLQSFIAFFVVLACVLRFAGKN
jgi:hypothetical protein